MINFNGVRKITASKIINFSPLLPVRTRLGRTVAPVFVSPPPLTIFKGPLIYILQDYLSRRWLKRPALKKGNTILDNPKVTL